MPPGTQPGFRAAQELELVRLSMEPAREAAEGVAALDQEWEQEQGEDATEHQQLQAGTGSDAAEAAAAAFDSATHQAYLDLPTWPEATEEELTVGGVLDACCL